MFKFMCDYIGELVGVVVFGVFVEEIDVVVVVGVVWFVDVGEGFEFFVELR